MTFSRKKFNTLRPQRSQAFSTFFIALLMAAAVFLPFMISDNGYFLFYGDFNVQQVPFYQHCHSLVRSGKIFWDAGTDLGVNFIGSYTFYLLGSPFFWLTLLFPNSFVPYLMGPLLILKFALAATTAYCYIARFVKDNRNAKIGGILYAFSGFSVYNVFFNHFHEAIIVFPLLLLSIELLITENRRGPFALAVAAAAISNYFFFFGMVVFAIIYWFVRILSGAFKMTVGRFLSLLLEAVLGFLMSAILMLPTIMALFGNSRLSEFQIGWGGLMYGKEQIYANIIEVFFFPPDLPARPVFFPGADVKWSSLGGWMPVFSMVGVFAFMMNRKGHWLRRVLGIMIFMALVPFLNSAFYMFNNAYYARWYYMPILMMSLATCIAIDERDIDWTPAFNWVAGITLAFTAVIGFFPEGLDENGKVTRFGVYTDDSEGIFRNRFFLTCAIAVVGLVMLRLVLNYIRKNQKLFFRTATAAVCVLSVVYSIVFIGLGKTHSYDVDSVMIPALLEHDLKLDGDRDTYRIDCYECVDNTGMYLGYNTINAFHSIVPVSVTEFYEFIDEERGVASRPTTDSHAARSLLSVKYLVDLIDNDDFDSEEEGPKMPGYAYLGAQSGYRVYENENYIPYGFTYDYYIDEEECLQFGNNGADKMMLKAMLLTPVQQQKYRDILRPLLSDYDFYYGEKPQIDISDESFAADAAARRATAAYEFSQTNDGFYAKTKLDRKNLVFFSIPYDEGWTAYVNGKEAEIEKVNIGFMAVLCDEGENEIRFVYRTPGLYWGAMITAAAVIVFIVYLLIARAVISRRAPENRYPEGDALLERWAEYDRLDSVGDTDFSPPQETPEEPFLESFPDEEDFSALAQNFPGGFVIRDDETEKTLDKTETEE